MHVRAGSQTVDSIFYVLLSTAMFIGGTLGFVLDNTIKGTQWNGIVSLQKKTSLFIDYIISSTIFF